MKKKNNINKKLEKSLLENRGFLLQTYKEEWENIQKHAKREELIRRAKEGAATTARALMGIALLGGILTVAAVAPNTFSAFSSMTRYRGYYDKKSFRKAGYYLKRRGFARLNKDGKNGYEIALTAKGERSLLRDIYKALKIKNPNKWDGYWRIVIFDIPRKENWARNTLREKLRALGFYRIQYSVFVHPYASEKEIGFLISIFNIAPFVHVITAKHVSMEGALKRHFGLL